MIGNSKSPQRQRFPPSKEQSYEDTPFSNRRRQFTHDLALHVAVADEPKSRTPNIVYIMADELGYYEPGFMGGKNIQTPNIDKMATEGMSFRNLFAGSSVCTRRDAAFLPASTADIPRYEPTAVGLRCGLASRRSLRF